MNSIEVRLQAIFRGESAKDFSPDTYLSLQKIFSLERSQFVMKAGAKERLDFEWRFYQDNIQKFHLIAETLFARESKISRLFFRCFPWIWKYSFDAEMRARYFAATMALSKTFSEYMAVWEGKKNIYFIDSESNHICQEEVYGARSLSILYGRGWLSQTTAFLLLPIIRLSIISYLFGLLQNTASSKKKIQPFVDHFHVDTSDFTRKLEDYRSFNDFFTHDVKPRKIDLNLPDAILPADGRYLVFPEVSSDALFSVKDVLFDLRSFLIDRSLELYFRGGAIVIARMNPTDYHGFHFPVSCTVDKTQEILGHLYSVNPIALAKRPSIFWENKRQMTILESEKFGKVAMVEVGATFVGAIHQTYASGCAEKSEKKGYFSFGGSTIVLLFQKGRINLNETLVKNSQNQLETKCRYGDILGSPTRYTEHDSKFGI